MGEENIQRTWDSVCRDCIHFCRNQCNKGETPAGPQDSIAAICREYEGRSIQKQNYIRDHVE